MKFNFPIIFNIESDETRFSCPYLKEVKGAYKSFDEAYKKAEIILNISVSERYNNNPSSLVFVTDEQLKELQLSLGKNSKMCLMETSPKIKYVKKTVTIPLLMSTRISEENIVLSKFLQECLRKKFEQIENNTYTDDEKKLCTKTFKD